MSAFTQKLARLGATAGVLAASTAAIFAVGGATAGSALAVPPPNCVAGAGFVLHGEGSTLQGVSQEEWTSAYNTDCPTASKINFAYTGTGSSAALERFGYTGGGSNLRTAEAYVGTDEAPEASQISEAHAMYPRVSPVIVPVAETSIAILAHLPPGCEIVGGINYNDLNRIFAGTIEQWSELETDNGNAACGSAITRVLPWESSGTTFQFKNYLSKLTGGAEQGVGPGIVETRASGNEPVCAPESWSAIRGHAFIESGNLNNIWPEVRHREVFGDPNSGSVEVELGCASAGTLSPVAHVSGFSNVAQYVKSEVGTIGFAAYPFVIGIGAISNVVPLENLNSEGEQHYGAPGTGTESKKANCEGRVYTRPEHASTGLEVDWSKDSGAKPTIGEEGPYYPLCMLTYDLSWASPELGDSGYADIGYPGGRVEAEAVKDYLLNCVLAPEGQSLLDLHGYQGLPPETRGAARVAAERIN